MGKPTDIKVFSNPDIHIEILNYRQEPVITKVSMIDGYLSGIACEAKTITTYDIPPFAQGIKIRMNPQQVISLYGQPTFVQPSVFKQQKVVDFVYATLNTDASTRFTFINDVLTRFSFIPQANFYHSK